MAEKILLTSSPYEAKSLGRRVKKFDDYEWNQIATRVMARGVFEKVSILT